MSTVNKHRLDKLLPKAIEAVRNGGFLNNGKISDTYQGYVSSFGADMINTTPLAAAMVAQSSKKGGGGTGTGTKEDKNLIPAAILEILRNESSAGVEESSEKLSDYLQQKSPDKKVKTDNIHLAAVALKIALRTFPTDK